MRKTLIDIFVIAAVFALHAGITCAVLGTTDVPPYFDAANHFNLILDYIEVLRDFHFSPDWLQQLNAVSCYYPPLYHLSVALPLSLVAPGLDVARACNLFWLAVLMGSSYLLGRRLYDRATAVLAAIVISCYPVVFGLTRDILTDLALLALVTLGAHLVLATEGFRHRGYSFLFGCVAALGILTKWTYPLFLIVPVLYALGQAFCPVDWRQITSQLAAKAGGELRLFRLLLTGLFIWAALFAGLFTALSATSMVLGVVVALGSFPLALLAVAWTINVTRLGVLHTIQIPSRRKRSPMRPAIWNLLLAAIPMLLLAAPWYVSHLDTIAGVGQQVMTTAAVDRQQPAPASTLGVCYYLVTMESHTLGLFFFLLFLLGVAVSLWRGPIFQTCLLLLSFIAAYGAITALRIQDPKYFMPILFVPALLTANPLAQMIFPVRRWLLIPFAAVCALIVVHSTWSLPGLSTPRWMATPAGRLFLTHQGVYGANYHRIDVPAREIVREVAMQAGITSASRPIEVAVLADEGHFHAPALNAYARLLSLPVRFFAPIAPDKPLAYRLHQVLAAPFVLSRDMPDTTSRPALPHVWQQLEPLYKELFQESGVLGSCMEPVRLWNLSPPLGGSIRLWANRMPQQAMPAWQDIEADFEGRASLQRVQIPTTAMPGGFLNFVFSWDVPSLDAFRQIERDCLLFIHLFTEVEDDHVPGAAQNFPGVFTQSLIDTNTRHNVDFQQDKTDSYFVTLPTDLPAGRYHARVGILDQTRLAKDQADFKLTATLADGRRVTDVNLPGLIEIREAGWTIANASFVDSTNAWLGTLISYRLSPTHLDTGEAFNLDCVWRPRDTNTMNRLRREYELVMRLLPRDRYGLNAGIAPAAVWTTSLPFSSLEIQPHDNPDTRTLLESYRFTTPPELTLDVYQVRVGVAPKEHATAADQPLILGNTQWAGLPALPLTPDITVLGDHWVTLDAAWPDGTALRFASMQPLQVLPGGRLELGLIWQPRPPMDAAQAQIWAASHQLFVHVCPLDSDEYISNCVWNLPVFEDPAQADREESLQRRFISLPEEISPGTYRVLVGLFDPNTVTKYSARLTPSGQTVTDLVLPYQLTVLPMPQP